MKLRNFTAAQLIKLIKRRPFNGGQDAAHHWAQRIEGGPRKSCIPKAKLRRSGLLPPVGDLVPIAMPTSKDDYPGCIVSDGSSSFMIVRLMKDGEEIEGQQVDNKRLNKWWGLRYPDGKVTIPMVLDQWNAEELKWYRRAKK